MTSISRSLFSHFPSISLFLSVPRQPYKFGMWFSLAHSLSSIAHYRFVFRFFIHFSYLRLCVFGYTPIATAIRYVKISFYSYFFLFPRHHNLLLSISPSLALALVQIHNHIHSIFHSHIFFSLLPVFGRHVTIFSRSLLPYCNTIFCVSALFFSSSVLFVVSFFCGLFSACSPCLREC